MTSGLEKRDSAKIQQSLLMGRRIQSCSVFELILQQKSTPIFAILNFAHILVQLEMKTQTRSVSRDTAVAYREFSRRRYKQLKEHSPLLRQSEIVQKIIQEWDRLSIEQRNSYRADNLATTPLQHTPKLAKPDKANLRTTGAKTLQEQPERSQHISDQLNRQGLGQLNQPNLEASTRRLFASDNLVTKSIRKTQNLNDYMTFYKFYLAKMKNEHPNWSPNQVTIIIKLMWKKRLLNLRKNRLIERKAKTGKKAFMQVQRKAGISSFQSRQNWKQMPFQSRVHWTHIGNPGLKVKQPNAVPSTMKLGMRSPQESRPESAGMVESEPAVNPIDLLNRR